MPANRLWSSGVMISPGRTVPSDANDTAPASSASASPSISAARSRSRLPLEASSIERPRMVAAPRSEEHTSELQSLMRISYDVFGLKNNNNNHYTSQQPHTHFPTLLQK